MKTSDAPRHGFHVENGDWSFGPGRAQFLTGELYSRPSGAGGVMPVPAPRG